MILGVMKTTTPYEQKTIHLTPNDTLVLFTDGVSEAMSKDSLEYGEERLETLLLHTSHQTAHGIIEAVHQDILEYAQGTQQSDDITMMVVKVS